MHSIVFDRMSIPFESQDQYPTKMLRLDVSSMHCARIVLDVVQRSQYVQDPCDFLSLGPIERKNTVCLLLKNLDLKVSIHC